MAGAPNSSQGLNFRIFHCTSQDPSFPVGELINMNKDQSQLVGWQSQRFCVYPQEIVLQFPCLVHLKQVQFLVHQNKIPSRIELFAYAPDFQAQANLVNSANITFSRLGHFSLDDNIRTNYQARELKTVYLEQYCQYLKLVLQKNHLNNLNIFNQVGLITITCTGSYIGEYEAAVVGQRGAPLMDAQNQGIGSATVAGGNLMPRNLKISGINDEELDQTVQDKIRVLNQAKLQAVEQEDFDKAKHLKDAIDKLKMAGSQLIQLEVQKKVAIENEDFDSAKVLKFEIERLRNLAMNLDTERVILAPIRQHSLNSQQIIQQHNNNHHYINQDEGMMGYDEGPGPRGTLESSEETFNQRGGGGGGAQFYSLEESKISQLQKHDLADQRHSLQPPHNQMGGGGDGFHQSYRSQEPNPLNHSQRQHQHVPSQQQLSQHNQLVAQSTLLSKNSLKSQFSEDQIVPALSMKKPIDFNTVGEDNDPNGGGIVSGGSQREDGASVQASNEELTLANIPQSQKPIADAMVPLFGEECACLVFAKAWANREKGIQQVITSMDDILAKDSENHSHNTILQVLAECLKDKVQQVTTKAFALVESYIAALKRNKGINPKSDISNTEKMLIQLLDRLADSKFSQKAEACYLHMFDIEQMDGIFLISFILKSTSYINKNMATSFKHQVPRLQIVNSILTEFPKYEKKITAATFPLAQLTQKIKEGVDASNPEHRKVSLQLIVTLYQQLGFKRVETLISELPLKHLEVLAKDIPEAEAYYKAKKHQPATKKD